MSPDATEGKIIGPAIEAKCKIDTDTAANVMPISAFRKLGPAMFDANGNTLDEFNKNWTILRAYGSGIIKQCGTRMIKYKWNNQKWLFLFHIIDAEGPTLLALKILRHMGIFSKHPRVYIKTIDLHFMNLALASEQHKEGEDGQNLSEYQNTISEVPKVGVVAHATPAEKLHVSQQANDNVVNLNVYLDLGEPDEYDIDDESNKVDDCPDHTSEYGVETLSQEIQNHPDYIPPETDLHKCPPILNKEKLKTMYPECFNGIGKFRDYKYYFSIEENAKHIIHPARKVAFLYNLN